MKMRSLFLASAALTAFTSSFPSFASAQPIDPNGPVGSCAYSQVYLNAFTFTATPDSSSTAIDLLPLFTPPYSGTGPWSYVVERGDDLPTGTLTFTPTNISDYSTFRIRFNHGDYVYLQEGQSTTAPLIAGTDLVEFDVIQPPCAGTDIQEYSITLYQNGSSILPPPPPPVESSTGPAALVCPVQDVDLKTSVAVVNGVLTYYADILTESAANELSGGFAGRLFTSFDSCYTGSLSGSDQGIWGYVKVSPTPDGVVARYESQELPVETCVQYNQHIVARLSDAAQTTCVYSSPSLDLPPPAAASTASAPPESGGGQVPTLPPPVPVEETSTASATPPTTCPYTPVYLNQFSLFLTETGSNTQIDFKPYITPTYEPAGPEFFYVIERGSDFATGTILFNPLDFTAGSTFRIRFNHGDYIYANAGEAVEGNLIAGTDLIEFDVIQAPCAGTDIQEYSITLYQNGTSKVPSLPPPVIPPTTTPPASGGDEVPPPSTPQLPPVQSPPTSSPSAPVVPPPTTTTPPPMDSAKVACQAITFTQAAIGNGSDSVVIQFNSTAADRTVEWVDFHVSINAALVAGSASVSAPQFNYRMNAGADANTFVLTFPTGADDVKLLANSDYINYFFTYCSEGTDCNTGVFNYANAPPATSTPPSSGGDQVTPTSPSPAVDAVCPHLNFTQYTSVGTDANGNDTFSFSWYSTTADVDAMWVDIHVTITSSTVNGQYNYRMFESPISAEQASQFTGYVPKNIFFLTMPGIDGVTIPQDATVTYFFTYCADGIDCNSDNFNFHRNPDQGGSVIGDTPASTTVCPAIEWVPAFQRSGDSDNVLSVNFTVTSAVMVEWVDLHVTINSALLSDGKGAYSPAYNYRMQNIAANQFTYSFPGLDGVSVPATSYVSYFFTYCAMIGDQKIDCNTEPGTYGATNAVANFVAISKADANANSNSNTNTDPSSSSSSSSNTAGDANSNSNANTNSNTNTNTNNPPNIYLPANSAMTNSVGSAAIITVVAALAALIL